MRRCGDARSAVRSRELFDPPSKAVLAPEVMGGSPGRPPGLSKSRCRNRAQDRRTDADTLEERNRIQMDKGGHRLI